jgi:hypothetical protein
VLEVFKGMTAANMRDSSNSPQKSTSQSSPIEKHYLHIDTVSVQRLFFSGLTLKIENQMYQQIHLMIQTYMLSGGKR